MNMTLQHKRFTRGGPLTAIAVSALLLLGSASSADAGHYGGHGGGILGGAIVGGAIGGVVKGKKGILPGAIIGGVVGGVASSAARPAPPPPPPPAYYSTPPPYYPPAPAPGYGAPLIYDIQSSLARLGYNPGPIDGIYGQRTADAISAYEYRNQLPVTGRPTETLRYQLKQAGG